MGYVYCFANDSMPELVKIGMTERTPEERLNEANASDTWRPPTPYHIVVSKKVNDPKKKEKVLHEILKEYRVHPNREFFRVSTEKIFPLFELMDGEYPKTKQEINISVFEIFTSTHIGKKSDGRIRETELYDTFSDWHKIYHGKNIPTRKEIIEYVTMKYSETPDVVKSLNSWKGLTLDDFI